MSETEKWGKRSTQYTKVSEDFVDHVHEVLWGDAWSGAQEGAEHNRKRMPCCTVRIRQHILPCCERGAVALAVCNFLNSGSCARPWFAVE